MVNRAELWHPRMIALAIMLGLGSVACGESEKSAEREETACLSLAKKSELYRGNPNADPKDQSTWTTGIEAKAKLPSEAKGLVVGYTSSTSGGWQRSKPMPTNMVDSIALRIGREDVTFTAQAVAEEGSALCSQEPDVTFGQPESFQSIIERGANEPEWP